MFEPFLWMLVRNHVSAVHRWRIFRSHGYLAPKVHLQLQMHCNGISFGTKPLNVAWPKENFDPENVKGQRIRTSFKLFV